MHRSLHTVRALTRLSDHTSRVSPRGAEVEADGCSGQQHSLDKRCASARGRQSWERPSALRRPMALRASDGNRGTLCSRLLSDDCCGAKGCHLGSPLHRVAKDDGLASLQPQLLPRAAWTCRAGAARESCGTQCRVYEPCVSDCPRCTCIPRSVRVASQGVIRCMRAQHTTHALL